MFGLIWWLILIGSIAAISFVVIEYLTVNNIDSYIKSHTTGVDEWFVDEIKGADRVIIGLKKKGKKVAGADVSCPNGHGLRVGDSGKL
jgi:hypothetical protein